MNYFKTVYILQILTIVLIAIVSSDKLHPIIFIPGDGGNQLDAKLNKTSVVHYICDKTSDFFNIWLNIELLVPIIIDCWIDNIRLIYDNNTRTTRNADGVDIRVPGFGTSDVVEWIDPSHASAGAYFKDIGNVLVAMGYTRNVSLRGAPYDFRRAPNENTDYFLNLKTLVEETYLKNGEQPVILLAHSMGGPMSLIFLQSQSQEWKDKYISQLVTLSGAWGGSVKAVKVFAIGDDLGAFMLRQKILRAEQITAPSTAFLLPSKLFWKPGEILVQSPKRNYTIDDLQQFFTDINYSVGWEMRTDTEKYLMNFSAPGVEVHCLYGTDVPTVEKLYYAKMSDFSQSPKLINGNGDGTVNIRSLQGCEHWSTQQKQKIYSQSFSKVDHMNILNHPDVLTYIKQMINKITRK